MSPYRGNVAGEVIFTPHLLPVDRGILSTIYLHFRKPIASDEIQERFSKFAERHEFVHFLEEGGLPDLKMTVHSNRCMIGAKTDLSGQNWIIVSSIDNLIKGASGQAIQNMNLMFGLNETAGLL